MVFSIEFALAQTDIENKSTLTLDRLFSSSEFVQESFGPYQWLGGGEFYTVVEWEDDEHNLLALYDSKTGDRSVLIAPSDLTPSGATDPIQIEDYQWSSDEKKILIFNNSQRVWRTNTRGDYWVLDLSTKKLQQLGKSLPPSSLMFAKFSPDAATVAYVSQHNIYLENLASEEITALTEDGTDEIINGTFDWAYEEEFFCKDGFRWSPDGKHIAYWQIDASGIGDYHIINNTDSIYPYTIPVQYPKVGHAPSSAKLAIIDVFSGREKWLEIPGDPQQHYLPRIQWLNENRLLITQLSRKQNHLKLFTYDPYLFDLKQIYEEKSDTWIDIVLMDVTTSWEMHDLISLKGGQSFIWISEKDGWRHLWEVQSDGSATKLITEGDFDVASLKGFDAEKSMLYYTASPSNPTQRYLYQTSITTGETTRVTPRQFMGVNNYDISPNGKYAVQTFASDLAPRKGYLISTEAHTTLDVLYENESFASVLGALDLPKVEFFKVTTEDGIAMDGKLIKPHDFDPSKKYPLIFYVYGEPAGQTATARMGNLWHYHLAQQGYLVITMDNRGSPSLKGTAWRKAIYRNIGLINARDQAMAAREVLKWDFVDAERVGVWGWSGGGAMTLNLMFKYPDTYKTGIAIAAVTNQLFYDNIYQERYMGLPQENPEDFREGSPYSHVDGLEGNLLYIHGSADDNVHYANAEYLINALIEANKDFDLMIYPNRSHGIYEGANTTRHLYQKMTNYFLQHLPPGVK